VRYYYISTRMAKIKIASLIPDQGTRSRSCTTTKTWHSHINKWVNRASLVAQRVKNLPAMQETWFDPRAGKIPCRRKWQPTPVFLPGEAHGQRNLADYSPWGCKELDMIQRLNHNHWQTQQLGWTSGELCWVKKSQSYIQLYLYNILERSKLERWRTDYWLPEVKDGGWGGGRVHRTSLYIVLQFPMALELF